MFRRPKIERGRNAKPPGAGTAHITDRPSLSHTLLHSDPARSMDIARMRRVRHRTSSLTSAASG